MYSLLVLCLNRYPARKAGHLEPMQLKLDLWHPYTLRQPAFHQCICLFCTFTSYRSGKYKITQTIAPANRLLFLSRLSSPWHDQIFLRQQPILLTLNYINLSVPSTRINTAFVSDNVIHITNFVQNIKRISIVLLFSKH